MNATAYKLTLIKKWQLSKNITSFYLMYQIKFIIS